jgi:hypothetical protein
MEEVSYLSLLGILILLFISKVPALNIKIPATIIPVLPANPEIKKPAQKIKIRTEIISVVFKLNPTLLLIIIF